MKDELIRDLKMRADMMSTVGSMFNIAAYILECGKAYDGEKLHGNVKRGEAHSCYETSTHMALNDGKGQTYVEGYVVRKNLPVPISHAWVIDGEGRVVDTVLDRPEDCAYFGIVISNEFLREGIAKTGYYGILDNLWRFKDTEAAMDFLDRLKKEVTDDVG